MSSTLQHHRSPSVWHQGSLAAVSYLYLYLLMSSSTNTQSARKTMRVVSSYQFLSSHYLWVTVKVLEFFFHLFCHMVIFPDIHPQITLESATHPGTLDGSRCNSLCQSNVCMTSHYANFGHSYVNDVKKYIWK